MKTIVSVGTVLWTCLVAAAPARGAEDHPLPDAARRSEIASLREEIGALRNLLQEMDRRLQALENDAGAPPAEDARPARTADRGTGFPEPETAAGKDRPVHPEPPPSPPRPAPGSVPTAQRLNVFNPQITVFGNALGRADNRSVLNEDGDPVDDRFNLREVELDTRAAIDPYAEGVAIFSYESEVPNEFEVGVEEAYVLLKRLPFGGGAPAGLKLKMGRMRSEFGSWNLLHTHDLPQSTRPLALRTFLGEEGFVQNGISGSFFLPTPGPASTLEWTLGVVDGGDIPVAAGNQGEDLAYLSRIKWFRTYRTVQDLEIGISHYFGRNDPGGNQHTLMSGLDFTYKWKPLAGGQWRSFLFGGEIYYASIEGAAGPNATPFGLTSFAQYQFNWHWYGGLRYDFTDRLEDDGLNTEALTLYASYYTSEYLRFRFGIESRRSDLPEEDGRNTGMFEVNFVFGSHPVEPYWVNR